MLRTALVIVLAFCLGGAACSRCVREMPGDAPQVPTPGASQPSPLPSPTLSPTPPYQAGQPSVYTLRVADGRGAAGEVIPIEVTLDSGTMGVSGFAITASLADPEIAEILGVELPEYGLTRVSELPGASVKVVAADLPGLLEGAFASKTIATLKLRLRSPGETRLLLDAQALDDDQGNAVNPVVIAGQLTVKPR